MTVKLLLNHKWNIAKFSMGDNTLQLKPGQHLDQHERQQIIFEIRSMIEDGKSTLPAICKRWNVTRPTAVHWRALALQQLEKSDTGFTRDAVRAMQIGRINQMIESLTEAYNESLRVKDLDAMTKISQQLKGHQDSLAKITGLNIDTHINVDATDPLVIIRSKQVVTHQPQDKQPMSHNIIEGEVTDGRSSSTAA